jgi:hypothetical protein
VKKFNNPHAISAHAPLHLDSGLWSQKTSSCKQTHDNKSPDRELWHEIPRSQFEELNESSILGHGLRQSQICCEFCKGRRQLALMESQRVMSIFLSEDGRSHRRELECSVGRRDKQKKRYCRGFCAYVMAVNETNRRNR